MIAAASLILAAAAGPAGVPGVERSFGDWAVTCDNVLRCEAVAISAVPSGNAAASDMRLAREPGAAGAITITFEPATSMFGVVALFIDGRRIGSVYPRDQVLTMQGAEAEGLARAMAGGRTLELRVQGRPMARYSLKGSSATLRYIDAEQGRAGGITALVARGAASAAAVPRVRALPRIMGVRPRQGRAQTLDDRALRLLASEGDCDVEHASQRLKPQFGRLDAGATLVMVPCQAGPRHSTHLAFILRNGKATPARFDFPPGNPGTGAARAASRVHAILNYDWSNGQLTTQPMPFYPGECGSTQQWVWDGERFRLTNAVGLGVCGRWGLWMTGYRSELVWR